MSKMSKSNGEQRGPRVLVGVPTRDVSVVSEFAQALALAAREPWFFGVLWVENDSDIVRGRGRAVAEFLDSDADALLMIDDDMVWTPQDVGRLLQVPRGKVVVGGVYAKRRAKGGLVYLGPIGEPHARVPEAAEVQGVGGGMMLVWREAAAAACALEDVQRHGGQGREWLGVFRQVVVRGDYLSEDYAFCHRVRQAGGQVYLHRAVRPGHVGRFVYTV
jgi:hypothetical protein